MDSVGGGLADILNADTEDGVRFVPFNLANPESNEVIIYNYIPQY
jgi:hypothetical protein